LLESTCRNFTPLTLHRSSFSNVPRSLTPRHFPSPETGNPFAELMAENLRIRDSQDDGFVESRDDIPLKESTDDEKLHERQDYPSTLQLIPILVGLCLQSICIALVGSSHFRESEISCCILETLTCWAYPGQHNSINRNSKNY
jgi:hypothetical protein